MNSFGHKVLFSRAREYVEKYHPLLIGVAGRLNQTLTKEAIALVLSEDRSVQMMSNSYNGLESVATSVLGVDHAQRHTHWWKLLIGSRIREAAEAEPDTHVVELGPSVPGDIDALAIAFPFFIGVITGVPSKALELFVDKKTVAHELQSLVVQLPRQGFAILNADDPLVATMSERIAAHVITYGSNPTADIRLVRSKQVQQGRALEIEIEGKKHELYMPHIITTEQALSALAALAVVQALQLNIEKALPQLTKLIPSAGHLKLLKGKHEASLLDASYDATPEDMVVALNALKDLSGQRRIAVLGLFDDLGRETNYWNKLLATKAGEVADVVILTGDDNPDVRKAVLQAGSDIHHFKTSSEAGKWLGEYLKRGDVVLVNGPKSHVLEEAVFQLLSEDERHHVALARDVKFA